MTLDVRLYLVTDPAYADLEAVVTAAVAGGVTCVQVRDKGASSSTRADLVRRLRAALPPEVLVLANDDVVAAREGDGLHVGLDDLSPVDARAALGPEAVIGWSISDRVQLDAHEQLAACDYVAASPVWSTPTKPDAGVPLGLDGVRAVADRVGGTMPVVAIGGIGPDDAEAVIAAGADGIAVVSAVCGADDPLAASAVLRRAVDSALAGRGATT